VRVRAELIAATSLPPRSFPKRLAGIGWLVHTSRQEVVVLGEDLAEVARFPLPSEWRASHWVTPDLGFVAVSEREKVLLVDRRGRAVWHHDHIPWGSGSSESGSCWVSPDGAHVWATVPRDDEPDEWIVLDASNGQVLGAAPLECEAAGSDPIPHPDGRHIGLSVGEGQDGAEVYWGRWEGGRPVVARLKSRSRVLVDVRPSGAQYLTTPHSSSDDGSVQVHEFPSGRVPARLLPDVLRPEDDRFDYEAGYLTDDLVLVSTIANNADLLLTADKLEPIGRVEYPDGNAKDNVAPSGRGTWLTIDPVTGRHELWRLREDA
jgi:hypothetical protein